MKTISPSILLGSTVAILVLLAFATSPLHAQDQAGIVALEQSFRTDIQALLNRYCLECHEGDDAEAEIDLAAAKTIDDVRDQPQLWQKVRAIIDSDQMPPKDAEQPSDAERIELKKWVRAWLKSEARAHAGDPGPVILRRLSNAEYNYTVRDLTGVESLDPTREFPVDGAAGEGFTNTGASQGMSSALMSKYLDAGKQVAEHVMLLPDGIRFSRNTTRRDQTDELLGRIQSFYREFTEDGGGTAVDLQGIKFDTNQGGVLPVKKYLLATIAERGALSSGKKTIEQIAQEQSLNVRYLTRLWNTLTNDSDDASLWITDLRTKWKTATVNDVQGIADEIAQIQQQLWKFNSVGQIGREGASNSWMEAVSPIVASQEVRLKLPEQPSGDVFIYLTANDLGDGNDQDFVVWQRPRIEFTNGQPILLRDLRNLTSQVEATIVSQTQRTTDYLDAILALESNGGSVEAIATARKLNPQLLASWSTYVGLGQSSREIKGHLPNLSLKGHGYDAINGWSGVETSLTTNNSNEPISFLTLAIPARSVVVHPSPTLESIVAWKSPIDGQIRITGLAADADNKCGNGIAWRVERLSASGLVVLEKGTIDNGNEQRFAPKDAIDVRQGDVVSLIVNPRDANHSCDTTHVEFQLSEVAGEKRVWNLAKDIVDNVAQGNPLADSYGNAQTWHFCARPSNPPEETSAIPVDSSLARWRTAVMESKPSDEIKQIAASVQQVLTVTDPVSLAEADRNLYQQLTAWRGPLRWLDVVKPNSNAADSNNKDAAYGLDPNRFGEHPQGSEIDAESLCLQAPQVVEVRLPAQLVAGAEFVTTGTLHAETSQQGSVQLRLLTAKPENPVEMSAAPIIVLDNSAARQRIEASMQAFRGLFPAALCYARIVPVDEVVTLTLYYREDDQLKRLMLDEQQSARLDQLWDELYYVSREPIALTAALAQIYEFATQDRQDLLPAFAALREPINARADAFRARLVQTEPVHLKAVQEFAARAWRRPLTDAEQQKIQSLYDELRQAEIPHDEAIRLSLARVMTSPAFLYKLEQPATGATAAPVTDLELATRLSYFLWSSLPDEPLRAAADSGRLTLGAQKDRDTASDELLQQTRRMMQDPRTRRLAIQFACQWLHVRDFDNNNDKNEQLYPEFVTLRRDMYEETVRFFEDMFRNDGSILDLLNADHTFLNESLARHYGIEGVQGPEWRRVDHVQTKGRGGILGMATILASQSGASRTSPILRGNWVYETLLGERLPRPPANVPQLPETVPTGLTARELIELHSSLPECAKCHVLIDPYGFALEQFDAVGRKRPTLVDTKTNLADGTAIEGLAGIRDYLLQVRRDDIMRQFCRKLLGYALGREILLSDEPLLDEIQTKLAAHEFRFSVAVAAIVSSRQFREIRGQSFGLPE
jgi:hypothetical protein